jgi:Ca2+-binding RTX toxin-like protein
MSYTTNSALNAVITNTGPNAVLDQQVQYQLENWLINNTPLNLAGQIVSNGSIHPSDQIVEFNGSKKAIDFNDNGTRVKAVIEDQTNTDLVLSGSNSIFVAMGDANDTLVLSDTGNDTVYAGSGNDSIVGGAGADQIYGGTGADTLLAGTGNNILEAGSEAGQHLMGGADAAGTQMLYDGQSGSDTLSAGSGGGAHLITGMGSDTLLGGTGRDILQIDGAPGSRASLTSGSVAGGYNDLISHSIAGDHDTLQGGAGADVLTGGAGADTLLAGTGNNMLEAGTGAGQDLVGGADTGGMQILSDYQSGSDTLSAGSGGGTHEIIGFGSDTLYGGTGPDTLEITGGPSGSDAYLQSGSLAGGYNDLISQSVLGDHDTLQGGAGNDTLMAGTGHDSLQAGSGNQTLMDGSAADTMTGGSGDDLFQVQAGGGHDDTINAGSGSGTIDFLSQATSDIARESDPGGNDWTITFTDGQVVQDNGVLNLSFTDDPNYHI